jgi:hypothetical protein
VAVAIADDPEQSGEELVSVPAAIQEYARHDRMALWSRKNGRDTMNSSCRNAAALLSKGWTFVEVCEEDRLRAVAEARPFPPAPASTPEPIINEVPGEARARDKKSHKETVRRAGRHGVSFSQRGENENGRRD